MVVVGGSVCTQFMEISMTNKTLNLVGQFEKSISDESDVLKIKGYANTTSKDRTGDIIEESAWLKGGLDNYLKNPIILAYHNHSKPIGTAVDYSVSSKGLEVVAEISSAAGEVYNLIKDGILKTFSVGFSIKDAEYDREDDIFYIKDLELLEISVVSVPANQDSTFSIAKALGDDYADFKKEYIESEETETNVDNSTEASNETILKENLEMDKIEELTLKMEALEKAAAEKEAAEKAAIEAEAKAAEEAAQAEVEEKKAAQIEVISTGVGRLETEVSKRLEDNDASIKSVIDDLRAELKENKDELIALRESKMQFATEEEKAAFSADQKSNGFLLGKIMRTGTEGTKFYKDLVEKAARHGHVPTEDWETVYNTEIYDLSRQKLVVADLFSNINMSSATMQIPTNPGADTGEWITNATQTGTGTAATATRLGNITLTAHKLVSKEYLPYEEEEDAIMPILPLIKANIAQRIANSTDIALLRGAATTADPIKGVVAEAGANKVKLSGSTAIAVVKPTDLQATRRKLGLFGQNPNDVVYVVSTDVYYDLMEDDAFKKADQVTDAQLMQIKGYVGSLNGSKVIVSDKFEAKAKDKACAVALNAQYFKTGTLRNLMTETFRDIEAQKAVIVSSSRFGFINLEQGSSAGKTVAALEYSATA